MCPAKSWRTSSLIWLTLALAGPTSGSTRAATIRPSTFCQKFQNRSQFA